MCPGFLCSTHTPLAASGPTMAHGRFSHARPVTGVSASVAGTSLQHEQASLPYNVLPACSAWKVDSSKEGVAGEMRYWREAFDAVDTDADGYQHTHAHGMPGHLNNCRRAASVWTCTCAWVGLRAWGSNTSTLAVVQGVCRSQSVWKPADHTHTHTQPLLLLLKVDRNK